MGEERNTFVMHCGPEHARTQTEVVGHSFAHIAHSFACSRLLALLAPSAALTRSFALFAHSLACGKVDT